ncbi:MAG TPA: carbohydrate kinase [Clostridiales bacterium]|nr:carbohydrate kinase [Clostridiales bacterium]
MKCDVICIGELLIDFTPLYSADDQKYVYEANPGGAPANVAVQLSRLGVKSGFVGKVGNDHFGRYLKGTLDSYSVCTAGLVLDNDFPTTLAFVHLDSQGDRSFTFYRKPGADTQLTYEDIDLSLLDNCRILHFGSLSFTDEPAKTAVLQVLEYAKTRNKIISYDPNWRAPLWKTKECGIAGMKLGLNFCDIIKVSDEELIMLTDCTDITEGINKLLNIGIKIVLVTLGPNGCYAANRKGIEYLNTYDVKAVDTTGSGDSFLGAFLYNVLQSQVALDQISIRQLADFADFSNAAGALCAAKRGSIPSMPDLSEIQCFRKNVPKK